MVSRRVGGGDGNYGCRRTQTPLEGTGAEVEGIEEGCNTNSRYEQV